MPAWGRFAQEEMSPTEIPVKLTQILRYHKGFGLFAKFEEEKKCSSYSGLYDPQVKSFFYAEGALSSANHPVFNKSC